MTRPPFIIDTALVPDEDGAYPGSDERLAFGRAIGKAAGLERIGLHLERVPPGRRTSYPHAEGDEEEFVYVLDGEIDAWIDGTLHRMKAGDLAAFPAGTGICHAFLNNGEREALLLVGGERSRPQSRLYYPVNPEREAQMDVNRWWRDVPLGPQGDHDGHAGSRLGRAARAWADQLAADGVALEPRRLGARPFGDSVALADQLAALVTSGAKTATTSLVWALEHHRRPVPIPGDLTLVTRLDGTPVCLIETTEVSIVRLSDVTAEQAAAEGEADGSLAAYQVAHAAYFGRECAAIGRMFTPDLPVVCERFRLLRVR